MATLNINSVGNGWTVTDGNSIRCEANDKFTKVARTPKELSALVESWASENGKPEEKKTQPK